MKLVLVLVLALALNVNALTCEGRMADLDEIKDACEYGYRFRKNKKWMDAPDFRKVLRKEAELAIQHETQFYTLRADINNNCGSQIDQEIDIMYPIMMDADYARTYLMEVWANDINKVAEKSAKCKEIVDRQIAKRQSWESGPTWDKSNGETQWYPHELATWVLDLEFDFIETGSIDNKIIVELEQDANIIMKLADQTQDMDDDYENGSCDENFAAIDLERQLWRFFRNEVRYSKSAAFAFLVTHGSLKPKN